MYSARSQVAHHVRSAAAVNVLISSPCWKDGSRKKFLWPLINPVLTQGCLLNDFYVGSLVGGSRYSRSSHKRPPRKFEKVVVTRTCRLRE